MKFVATVFSSALLLILAFPDRKCGISGHGKSGGVELPDYTIDMFR